LRIIENAKNMKIEEEIKGIFRNEYHKARINIYYTNSYLCNKFLKLVEKHTLTPTQYNILRILRHVYPNTASQVYIKERLLDKNSDVSRITDRLLAKKLITSIECNEDRRKKDIKITSEGLDLIAGLDNCETKLDEQLYNLTAEEVVLLNQLLDKIRH
jgi:DNA-binding MarR family transcriptional regulator